MNLFMERCRGGRILGEVILAPWGMSIPKSEAFLASAIPVLLPCLSIHQSPENKAIDNRSSSTLAGIYSELLENLLRKWKLGLLAK